VPVADCHREIAPSLHPARRVPRRASGPSVTEVTDLARELTADLTRAAETNARLKSDLDAALAALRLAAEESQRNSAPTSAPPRRRPGQARRRVARLRADIELLEPSGTARSRKSPGSRASCARRKPGWPRPRGSPGLARRGSAARAEALQRLTAELHVAASVNATKRAKDLLAARSERERLSEELLAAHCATSTPRRKAGTRWRRISQSAGRGPGAHVRNSLSVLATLAWVWPAPRPGLVCNLTPVIFALHSEVPGNLISHQSGNQLVHRTGTLAGAPHRRPLIFWKRPPDQESAGCCRSRAAGSSSWE